MTLTNVYADLPDRFHAPLVPAPFPSPEIWALNEDLADGLGLPNELRSAAILSGAATLPDTKPVAMAYAGHQFGNFVPSLGDGRAVLLGEINAPGGERFDIHLKGAGRTAFSRGGDGRAVLGAALREYVVAEAMAALGVPTTRALAISLTGEQVMRDGYEPGAVLARVARGHIRVGTFQYFAARQDLEGLGILLDHTIQRLHPDLDGADNPALALLERVSDLQADLIARWMGLGFVHGVMNTDNMSLSR